MTRRIIGWKLWGGASRIRTGDYGIGLMLDPHPYNITYGKSFELKILFLFWKVYIKGTHVKDTI